MARRLGKPLMPHQQLIADVALEIEPSTGLLAYSEVILIGPRQATGKTELLLPVATHRCVGFTRELTDWVGRELGIALPVPPPQRVVWTAQTADDAKKKWRDVHLERLKKSSFGKPRPQFTSRLRNNLEQISWKRSGSTWSPASTTGKTGGTGDSIDLGILDEAWSRPDNRTELGMRPAMMTRMWRQLWVASMIPGLSRAQPGTWPYLLEKRRTGRARVAAAINRGVAIFDFSAPEGSDPGDPATWYSCMPGLGRTVSEQTIRDDFEAMSAQGQLVDFEAEYLGWEPTVTAAAWGLIRRRTWDDRFDAASSIAGRPALSLEFSEDRSQAWICAAGYRDDGNYHVELVEPGQLIPVDEQGVDWAERRLVDIYDKQSALCVVVDPRRPAASLIPALKQRGFTVVTPSQPEIAGACGRIFDATGERRPKVDGLEEEPEDDGLRLFHLSQRVLDLAVSQARPLPTSAGAFVFVRRGAAAQLGPLYGVTLALHGLVVAGVDEEYDLLESVDMTRPCGRCRRYTYMQGDGTWLHADDDSPAC